MYRVTRRAPLRPCAVWRLTEMNSLGVAGMRAAEFDPATGRIFMTEDYGEEPIAHVFRLATPR